MEILSVNFIRLFGPNQKQCDKCNSGRNRLFIHLAKRQSLVLAISQSPWSSRANPAMLEGQEVWQHIFTD